MICVPFRLLSELICSILFSALTTSFCWDAVVYCGKICCCLTCSMLQFLQRAHARCVINMSVCKQCQYIKQRRRMLGSGIAAACSNTEVSSGSVPCLLTIYRLLHDAGATNGAHIPLFLVSQGGCVCTTVGSSEVAPSTVHASVCI